MRFVKDEASINTRDQIMYGKCAIRKALVGVNQNICRQRGVVMRSGLVDLYCLAS